MNFLTVGDKATVPLIGLAHGSRHPGVTASVEDLMAVVSAGIDAPAVGAYLDLTDPDLTSVACTLAAQGHRRAVIVPLLFTEAFHATVDVPEAVRTAAEVSGLDLLVAHILGTGADLLEVVQQSLTVTGTDDSHSLLLFAVGSSSPEANAAIHDFAERLAGVRSGQVRAAFGTRDPRAADVVAQLPQPVTIVPLFVSPGLLLDQLSRDAAERGDTMAPPLGNLLAPVVQKRYRDTVTAALG